MMGLSEVRRSASDPGHRAIFRFTAEAQRAQRRLRPRFPDRILPREWGGRNLEGRDFVARRERVFNFRRKPYRPRYSWGEFQATLAILILLGAIALWVSWKGRHPEPKLFSPAPATLKVGGIEVYERPLVRWTEGAGKPSQAGSTRSPSASPLSPFPETLLSPP
ncbi:MAG: hypothetical protein D6795_18545, partial [Deltaproteobacteria bacterium]